MVVSLAIALGLLTQQRALPTRAERPEPEAPLVFENGRSSQYLLKDNVLRLRAGSGWMRTRRVWNDFVLVTEFRLADSKTEAGVGVRTLPALERWPTCGYRVRLSASTPAGALEGRQIDAVIVQAAKLAPIQPGEWHALIVKGEGRRVTVTIDGAIAIVAEIDHLFGSILFDVARGAVEFRDISFRSLPMIMPRRLEDPEVNKEIVQPRLVKMVKPNYTGNAMRRMVEGKIEFEIIIKEDGSVGAVMATKAGDLELEQAGMAAVAQWRFAPAMLNGKPVAVVASVELTFKLRD